MEIKGKIIAVLPQKSGVSKAGKEWQSQEYVLETSDQYPKKMCFTVFGSENINTFGLTIGETATIYFNVDAKQWQDRWFNSITAWKVDKEANTPNYASSPTNQSVQPAQSKESTAFNAEQKDDLPF